MLRSYILLGKLVYFWEARVVNYIIHMFFWTLYLFCEVGIANSRVGTGIPRPIRGAAHEIKKEY